MKLCRVRSQDAEEYVELDSILIKPKKQIKSLYMYMFIDTYIYVIMALKDTIRKWKDKPQDERKYATHLRKVLCQNIKRTLTIQ